MHARLRDCTRLTDTTWHHAFTDLCRWREHYYCAYRVAPSHNIVPKGSLVVQRRERGDAYPWYSFRPTTTFEHPLGDLRDPKFLATPDVLYLLCGAYLSNPATRHLTDGLTTTPGGNILQTHCAYTTNGETWSPLCPILRPNYWGWSAVGVQTMLHLATYHTGAAGEPSSIVLWRGTDLGALKPMDVIYEGASFEKEGRRFRYPATAPCEPVLWYDADTALLGCAIRTSTTMQLGCGKFPYGTADWRWHDTGLLIHPSAVLQTSHGLLLAGRNIEREAVSKKKHKDTYATTTALYALEGQRLTHLLTLPSSGDTGYAGLCAGEEEGTVMISWYSQNEVPVGLPGAAVYVATVEITSWP